MRYVEAPARGPARRFVQAFWQSTGFYPPADTRRVLPDACVDFIFDLASSRTSECATVIGTMTRPITVSTAGRRDLFGIRFRPAMAALLWPMPMHELCDDRTGLGDIAPDGADLADRLSTRSDFNARVAFAESWIERRLRHHDVDSAMTDTIAAVNDHLTRLENANALTTLTGWNERKLQRFFATAYGTTFATLRCFWRFEAVRRALTDHTDESLSMLALRHGYADQAHMAREFRRFAGASIGEWYRDAATGA